jgi:hypothetical protein
MAVLVDQKREAGWYWTVVPRPGEPSKGPYNGLRDLCRRGHRARPAPAGRQTIVRNRPGSTQATACDNDGDFGDLPMDEIGDAEALRPFSCPYRAAKDLLS